jgi:hypothetical protein
MGLLPAFGAVGTMLCKIWGIVLLWVYMAGHAALFIKYLEIKPKLIVLALQIFHS